MTETLQGYVAICNTGQLVERFNIEELCQAVLVALEQRNRGLSGRNSIARKYSLDICISSLAKFFIASMENTSIEEATPLGGLDSYSSPHSSVGVL